MTQNSSPQILSMSISTVQLTENIPATVAAPHLSLNNKQTCSGNIITFSGKNTEQVPPHQHHILLVHNMHLKPIGL